MNLYNLPVRSLTADNMKNEKQSREVESEERRRSATPKSPHLLNDF